MTVDDGKGAKVDWRWRGALRRVLLRAGWERDTLKVGETITVFTQSSQGQQPRVPDGAGRQKRRHDPEQRRMRHSGLFWLAI